MVPKWPFFLADGVLVAAAGLALWFSSAPPSPGAVASAILLLLLGVVVSLAPYLVEFYWNWQKEAADARERLEAQQQTMARVAKEVGDLISRLEGVDLKEAGPAQSGGPIGDRFEEMARALGQWQSQLEEREGRFASEMEQCLVAENEKRAQFRDYLDSVLQRLEEHASMQTLNPLQAEEELDGLDFEEPVAAPAKVVATETAPAVLSAQNDGQGPTAEDESEGGESGEAAASAPVEPTKRRSTGPRKKLETDTGGALFSSTTLVATAFIGASNRLYLRGEGPGLSWEEGVPMQFVEIGKWSWTTTDATGPIQVQVYKNDQEADRSGVMTVEPGQKLSLRPEFEA